jgi:uracil-DNA glycosylase family 4
LKKLDLLRRGILDCRRCDRSRTRQLAVPGEGNLRPGIVLLGEAPGKKEDLSGRPFVGRAGAYLEKVLASHGVARQNVFITLILKCYSPKPPRKSQIEACRSWTEEQLEALKPKIILVMGGFAAYGLLGLDRLPRRPAGFKWHEVTCIVTCHPAAAMRFPERNRQFRGDLGRLFRRRDLMRKKMS